MPTCYAGGQHRWATRQAGPERALRGQRRHADRTGTPTVTPSSVCVRSVPRCCANRWLAVRCAGGSISSTRRRGCSRPNMRTSSACPSASSRARRSHRPATSRHCAPLPEPQNWRSAFPNPQTGCIEHRSELWTPTSPSSIQARSDPHAREHRAGFLGRPTTHRQLELDRLRDQEWCLDRRTGASRYYRGDDDRPRMELFGDMRRIAQALRHQDRRGGRA